VLQGVRVDLSAGLAQGQHAQAEGTEGVLVPLPPLPPCPELGDHLGIGDRQLKLHRVGDGVGNGVLDYLGDVADCMTVSRLDPMLKPKPSFYRIALQAVGGQKPLSGDMRGGWSARSRDKFPSGEFGIYFPIPLAERWSAWGPIGDASAAFFFSKELGVDFQRTMTDFFSQ
jgi:hypothetical protein